MSDIISDQLRKSVAIFSLLLLPFYLIISNSAIEDVMIKKEVDTRIANIIEMNDITEDVDDLYGYKIQLVSDTPANEETPKQQQFEVSKEGEKTHVFARKIFENGSSRVVIVNNVKNSYELSSISKLEMLCYSGLLYLIYALFVYKIIFKKKAGIFDLLHYTLMYFAFFALSPIFIEAFIYPAPIISLTERYIKILLFNGFLVICFMNYNMSRTYSFIYLGKELEDNDEL